MPDRKEIFKLQAGQTQNFFEKFSDFSGLPRRHEKLALDVEYVENAGFRLDMKIIFITVWQVFARKSIYEKHYSATEHTRGQNQS